LNGATTCKKCGKELYQRADDNPETVESRLNTYSTQTAPLIDYYKKQGKLITIQSGKLSPSEVFALISAELDKYLK
jgi:adenylate kinase